MTIPAKVASMPTPDTIENVLIRGDLSQLTQAQRAEYYMRLCNSIGLNPLTKPFQYITLNGKLVLYAGRDCADQLRKINGISIEILSQEKADGLLTIHVRAKDKDGRQDEDLGVVAFSDALKGEVAANTILKAVTKAKRRVTLSLSGLGFLDETEVADIPAANKKYDPVEMLTDEQAAQLCQLLDKLSEKQIKEYRKLAGLNEKQPDDDIHPDKFDAAIRHLEKKVKENEHRDH